jgi:hypothetical protein
VRWGLNSYLVRRRAFTVKVNLACASRSAKDFDMTIGNLDTASRAGTVDNDFTVTIGLQVNVPVRSTDDIIAVDIEIATKLGGGV